MSNEEILAKYRKDTFNAPWIHTTDAIFPAMDEYAKQEAIEFETWIRIQECNGNREIYGKTPSQLYDYYKSKQSQNTIA